jgi:hypothetical protein
LQEERDRSKLISTNAYLRRTNAYWDALGEVMKQERKKQERRIVHLDLKTGDVHLDLKTGEVLKGYLIWKDVKYSPYYGGWYMQSQQALVSLAQDKEITGECYRVLFILLAEVDYENFIYIPQTEIARKLNMHPQSVHRAIKLLVQKGVLLRNERGFRLNANYGWKGKVRHLESVRRP